jgi:hypothetical protein
MSTSPGVVLDEQHLNLSRWLDSVILVLSSGRAVIGALSVDPGLAGSTEHGPADRRVSSQIRPPWYSTIFLHIDRPMPVPP